MKRQLSRTPGLPFHRIWSWDEASPAFSSAPPNRESSPAQSSTQSANVWAMIFSSRVIEIFTPHRRAIRSSGFRTADW
jgi:hypothetical protein